MMMAMLVVPSRRTIDMDDGEEEDNYPDDDRHDDD